MGVLATQSRAAQFRQALAERAVQGDGAMGTMLLSKRNLANRCLDELNLSLPALVRDVHQGFLRAGAEVVRTNTFGANRKRLETFGFGDKVRHVNHAGARIAREAARDQAFVAGCVGPLGTPLEPLGLVTAEEARALFRQQIDALLEAGVDLLSLETFGDVAELREAVLAARESVGDEMVIAAHVSVDDAGMLMDGATPEDYAQALEQLPADLIGVNCSSGPASVLRALERVSRSTSKPLSAAPSAGFPEPCSPEYLARYTQRFLRIGATLVSGCCGATPEHIRAMRAETKAYVRADLERGTATREPVPEPREPLPLAERSAFGAKLAAREFVTIREIEATRSPDDSAERAEASRLKKAGADAVRIKGRTGAKSAAAACQAVQQAGVQALLEISSRSPRDLQGDLLGAHSLGLRNVLLHSAAAIHIAKNLNQALDLGGHSLDAQTSFVIGARLSTELPAEAAAEAGADFAITAPRFEAEEAEPSPIPLIVPVRQLAGARDAEFLLNEKRVEIPASVMARINMAETPEAARAEGESIARELAEFFRSRAAGIELIEPGE